MNQSDRDTIYNPLSPHQHKYTTFSTIHSDYICNSTVQVDTRGLLSVSHTVHSTKKLHSTFFPSSQPSRTLL
ncbi:hypothetical protein PsorP6_004891 [Peronosclerospora sorghi]|uniref:Uncharacterized protein n=1 Tax=Peronosclerospora sorghi TaxID=230839 RepID=A0ACC0W1R2_9STRA|nr:hypothetical protein PsorP6_004891 [Peronosclerospora sorghi]